MRLKVRRGRRSVVAESQGARNASGMDFDKILQKCGDAGRYQYLTLALLGYIAFASTVHFFSQNIISFVPDHWCHHEQLLNRSYEEIAAIYAPFGKRASCTRLESIQGDGATANVTLSSAACQRWIYKYDFGFRSINAEMNWVCDDAYKVRIGQSLFFLGSLLGTLTFGILGDKIGRVPALILANQCGFIGDFCTAYVTSLVQFSVCRFISGWSANANYYLMFILVLEYLAPKLRNVAFNLTLGICFCLGALTAPWLSVLAGNWRIYLTCSSLTLLAVALFYFVVQESAQWLITRNNIEGAIMRLKHIAHFNGREVTAADFDAFRRHCIDKHLERPQHQHVQLTDMLSTPRLRKTFLIAVLTFMMHALAFNTITRNVEGLGLSPFIVFSLFALVVPVSGLVQGVLQSRLGRKGTSFLAMLFTGLFSCAMGLALSVDATNTALLLGLSLPMRFGVSICYTAGSLFCSELLPTCVRSRGLAFANVAGAGASFLSPYIIHLGTKFAAGPSLILAVLLLIDALTTLMLPETNNRQLPITLDDGEQFGKGEKMFAFDCLGRQPDKDAGKQQVEEVQLMQRHNGAAKGEAQ